MKTETLTPIGIEQVLAEILAKYAPSLVCIQDEMLAKFAPSVSYVQAEIRLMDIMKPARLAPLFMNTPIVHSESE